MMRKFTRTLNSLQIGDRIVVPKSSLRWVQHHAIYIGWENGQQWFIENHENYGVRTLSAEQLFTGVTEVTRIVAFTPRINYSRNDLVRYALSLRGRKYDLLSYNCESFANQVQHNKVESEQVKTGLALGALAVGLLLFLPLIGRK